MEGKHANNHIALYKYEIMLNERINKIKIT